MKKNNQSITIGFAGDVMLGRLVNEKIKQTSPTYPWGNVLPLLRNNDLNIINLETTLTKHKKAVPKVFNFRSEPEHVQSLLAANIHIVCLANNHMRDFGIEGLEETLQTLDKAGIKHVGAGMNIEQARKAVIIEKSNIRLGIIAFTDNEPGWLATQTKPGINYIKVGDIESIQKMVNTIRDKVDVIIATMHWGPNMREKPSQEFIDFAHQMIDAGIDIIHGHSAHIFQGIEVYKNKLIMYDTGDFVDDYMVTPSLRNDLSFLFQVQVDKDGFKSLKLIPVHIGTMQVNLAKSYDAQWALERMRKFSKEFGTDF